MSRMTTRATAFGRSHAIIDGHPSARESIDGLQRHGVCVRHEQSASHGNAQGGRGGALGMPGCSARGQGQRMSQAQSDNRMGQALRDCRGSTCSSQTRGPIPMGTRGQVGMSNKLSAS